MRFEEDIAQLNKEHSLETQKMEFAWKIKSGDINFRKFLNLPIFFNFISQ